MYSSSTYLVSSITRYPGQVYLLLRGSQLARVVGMVGCEVNLLAIRAKRVGHMKIGVNVSGQD